VRTSARTNCLSHQLDADSGSLSLLIDKTQREWTALHAAAAGGHETIAGVLLENGADPGAKAQGVTAGMLASENGFVALARGIDGVSAASQLWPELLVIRREDPCPVWPAGCVSPTGGCSPVSDPRSVAERGSGQSPILLNALAALKVEADLRGELVAAADIEAQLRAELAASATAEARLRAKLAEAAKVEARLLATVARLEPRAHAQRPAQHFPDG